MSVSSMAWFNGQIVEREAGAPSVASLNFHLGTSVFDGFMAYWNVDHYYLHYAKEHLCRFQSGAKRMGLPIIWTVEEMLDGVRQILAVEPKATQYVRPIAYRREPELWVTGAEGRPVDVSIFTVPSRRDVDELLTCHVSEVERISSRAIPGKTKVSGAYVNSFAARRGAETCGFNEAIMLDRQGRVTEASAANLFFIEGDRLVCVADNPDIFPGITRDIIKSIARQLDIKLVDRDVVETDLYNFQGAFLCSTLMEIRGLSCIGDYKLNTSDLAIFKDILSSFRDLTHCS